MSSTRSVNPPRSRIPVPLESGNTSTKPVRSGTQSMRTSQRPMKATHDDNWVAHSSTAKMALSPIYSESETSSLDSIKRWKSIPLRSKQNTPRYKPSINDKTHESTLIAKNVNQMKSETSFNSSLEPRSCISIPVKVEFEIKVNPKYANQNKSIVDQVANKQSNHGASCKRTVANIKDILKTVLTCLKTGKHFAKVDISFDFKPDSLGQKQSLPGTMRRLPMPVDMKDISAIDIDLAVWAPRFLDISHADNDIQYAKSPMGTLHDMQGVAFTSRGSLFTPLMCSTPRVDELIYGVCETITKHDGVNWREAEIVSPGERYHLQKPAVAISKRPDNVPRLNILVSPVGRNDTRFMQMFDDSSDLSTDRSFTLQRSIENSWQDYSRPMMQVRPPFVPRLNLRDLEGFELHSKKKCAPTFRASDSQSNENVPVFKRHTSLNKDTGQQKELVQRQSLKKPVAMTAFRELHIEQHKALAHLHVNNIRSLPTLIPSPIIRPYGSTVRDERRFTFVDTSTPKLVQRADYDRNSLLPRNERYPSSESGLIRSKEAVLAYKSRFKIGFGFVPPKVRFVISKRPSTSADETNTGLQARKRIKKASKQTINVAVKIPQTRIQNYSKYKHVKSKINTGLRQGDALGSSSFGIYRRPEIVSKGNRNANANVECYESHRGQKLPEVATSLSPKHNGRNIHGHKHVKQSDVCN